MEGNNEETFSWPNENIWKSTMLINLKTINQSDSFYGNLETINTMWKN